MVVAEGKRAVQVHDGVAIGVLEEVTLGLLEVQEVQRLKESIRDGYWVLTEALDEASTF